MISMAGNEGTTVLASSSLVAPDEQGLMASGAGMLTKAAVNGYGQQEEDADRLGLQYMVEAGDNPDEMVEVFAV